MRGDSFVGPYPTTPLSGFGWVRGLTRGWTRFCISLRCYPRPSTVPCLCIHHILYSLRVIRPITRHDRGDPFEWEDVSQGEFQRSSANGYRHGHVCVYSATGADGQMRSESGVVQQQSGVRTMYKVWIEANRAWCMQRNGRTIHSSQALPDQAKNNQTPDKRFIPTIPCDETVYVRVYSCNSISISKATNTNQHVFNSSSQVGETTVELLRAEIEALRAELRDQTPSSGLTHPSRPRSPETPEKPSYMSHKNIKINMPVLNMQKEEYKRDAFLSQVGPEEFTGHADTLPTFLTLVRIYTDLQTRTFVHDSEKILFAGSLFRGHTAKWWAALYGTHPRPAWFQSLPLLEREVERIFGRQERRFEAAR
nr:hypothetical protein L204_05779 [Cryptococcus depauperatus CBS 7855]